MKYKIIKPVPNLSDLKFLSTPKTVQEYQQQCRGPYLVAEIRSRKTFDTIPDGNLCFCSSCCEDTLRAPLNPNQQRMLTEIEQLNTELGFPSSTDFMFDTKMPEIGEPIRAYGADIWHLDGGRANRELPANKILHTYIASNRNGTEFIPEAVTTHFLEDFLRAEKKFEVTGIEQFMSDPNKMLQKTEAYKIYLFTPFVWHRSPRQQDSIPRVFMRYWCDQRKNELG